jgi:hypothetical protein
MIDKRSPRVGAIIFGFMIFFAYFLIPEPNDYSNDNGRWPNKDVHVYCNHALLWVWEDQPCHYGPVTRGFMADLQMLAKHPVYAMILNVVPYPAIVGFLVVAGRDN